MKRGERSGALLLTKTAEATSNGACVRADNELPPLVASARFLL